LSDDQINRAMIRSDALLKENDDPAKSRSSAGLLPLGKEFARAFGILWPHENLNIARGFGAKRGGQLARHLGTDSFALQPTHNQRRQRLGSHAREYNWVLGIGG
jgi:hypothetical protein